MTGYNIRRFNHYRFTHMLSTRFIPAKCFFNLLLLATKHLESSPSSTYCEWKVIFCSFSLKSCFSNNDDNDNYNVGVDDDFDDWKRLKGGTLKSF